MDTSEEDVSDDIIHRRQNGGHEDILLTDNILSELILDPHSTGTRVQLSVTDIFSSNVKEDLYLYLS